MTEKHPEFVAVQDHLSSIGQLGMGIFWISSTTCSSNNILNFGISQLLLFGLRSWETTKAIFGLASTFGVGMKPRRSGIHGSIHVLMEFPLPTKRQVAFAIRCFVPTKLFQKGDALLGEWWASQLTRILYFAFKTLIQKQTFPDRIHKPSLERQMRSF